MSINTPFDYYEKIKEKLEEKRNSSLQELVIFIFENKGAQEICKLTSKKIPEYIEPFYLTTFEKKSYQNYEKIHLKEEYISIEDEVEEIIEHNKEVKNTQQKYNLKIINHIKSIKNKKLKFNFTKEKEISLKKFSELNEEISLFFNLIEKEIDLFSFKMTNDIIEKMVFTPKFSPDFFSAKLINFMFDRNYNINDYNILEDFFKEFCGDVAIDAESLKTISLNYKDAYLKEIEIFITDLLLKSNIKNFDIKEAIIFLCSKKIFFNIKNIKIKELFFLYELKENEDKYKIFIKNSEIEELTNNNIKNFINCNKSNSRYFVFYEDNEEFEKEFDILNFSFSKEIYYKNKEKEFESNLSNYYSDLYNINLLIVLEETTFTDKGKKVVKLSGFNFSNHSISEIKNNKNLTNILPKNITDKYKIIIY